jgi:hypothetical protein
VVSYGVSQRTNEFGSAWRSAQRAGMCCARNQTRHAFGVDDGRISVLFPSPFLEWVTLSAWILKSHIRMMPEKGSKGNLDPSRASAPGDADTPVAGRDGPAVLPDSAGDGSWRSAVAGAGLGHGTSDRNSAARGHSADRSRTPRGIHRRGKPVAEEPLRQVAPCPPGDGAGQRQTIMSG